MQLELTILGDDGVACDVRVRAPGETPLRAVIGELSAHLPAAVRGLWRGALPLPPDAGLADLGLRTGEIVRAGGGHHLGPIAAVRLHVVGGPWAGRIAALPRGETVVGRAAGCDVVLDDPRMSRRHALISITSAGVTVRDLGSTNGTVLDGHPVTDQPISLRPGAHLQLGESTLSIALADEPPAAVRGGEDGTVLLHRAPRAAIALRGAVVVTPEPPREDHRQRVQLLAALLPALAGAAFALVTHQLVFLAFAVAGPAALLASALAQRRRARRKGRTDGARFETDRRRVEVEIAAQLADEARERRRAHRDPAALGRSASGPSTRIWERQRGDEDFLTLRLGLADLPSRLLTRSADAADPLPAGVLASVPMTLSLRDGPIGICGPQHPRLALARWLVGQLAALHSPADVSLVVLSADAGSWSWARRLPHLSGVTAREGDHQRAVIADLSADVERRRQAAPARPPAAWPGSWTVLVVDGDAGEAAIAGLTRLLHNGPSVGITAVCLADQRQRLPAGCTVIASAAGELGGRLHIESADEPDQPECVADQVSLEWAVATGRALMPLRDAGGADATSIPAACGLLQLHHLAVPSPAAVIEGWSDSGRPVATIGVGADGPVRIDLALDGPHVLIAGTTGSGKSELLRSLVTGLALRNSPRDISFILIDYKGGAAFSDCARLPHTAGLVTDLDPQLTQRALRSLNAELRRREALLAAAGAADLNGYRAGPRRDADPLDRLVIVVDEFATLADEQPDLLGGLLAIARRGRSLGVHLVLATQRPGGVVSAEIQANLALRIALRVTDPAESSAVVGTAAAAGIDQSRPGRAIVRTGLELREFQAARIGLPLVVDSSEVRVDLLDSHGDALTESRAVQSDTDDLRLLVDSMRSAADAAGFVRGISPWLPPLPDSFDASVLPSSPYPHIAAIGLVDLPDHQRQEPLTVDLQGGGSLLVAGPARSGRSTALATLARIAARQLTPRQLQIHIIDCAGGSLAALGSLPHCAAALTRDDPDAVGRLLSRLGDEVSRRQSARDATASAPALLLLIDGWEGFVESSDSYDPGTQVDTLHALLREAASARLTVAVAGAGAALNNRVTSSIGRAFALGGVTSSSPATLASGGAAPGRALGLADGNAVQFALAAEADPVCAGPDSDPVQQSDHPIVIRPLSSVVRRCDLRATLALTPTTVVLGAGGDEAEPVSIELGDGDRRWLIAGPPRSGRTTLLSSMLAQLHQAGVATLVAASRRSALAELAARLRVDVIGPDTTAVPPSSDAIQVVLIDDCEVFDSAPLEQTLREIAQRVDGGGPAVVVSARSEDAATSYRGIIAAVRRSHTGVLLRPAPADGDLLGVRLPRVRATLPPGRGVLVADQPHLQALLHGRTALPVQIAL